MTGNDMASKHVKISTNYTQCHYRSYLYRWIWICENFKVYVGLDFSNYVGFQSLCMVTEILGYFHKGAMSSKNSLSIYMSGIRLLWYCVVFIDYVCNGVVLCGIFMILYRMVLGFMGLYSSGWLLGLIPFQVYMVH